MEPSSGVPWKCITSRDGHILHIQCHRLNKYVELQSYFQKLGNDGHDGPSPEVILRFGEAEVAIHATVLAALSSSWREYLHTLDKDLDIIHTLTLNIPKGHEFLAALRSLLYSGETVLSETAVEDFLTVVNNLNLDNMKFTVRNNSNKEQVLYWEGHHDLLMNGLQHLCTKQLCADLSIFVKGHLIKVHRLVFGAFSPLLKSIFKDNKKTRLLHLPGFSVESVQNLVSLMYFGKANITESSIQEFQELCMSLGVSTLEMATKQFCVMTSEENERKGSKKQNYVSISLRPEIKSILYRLNALYKVKNLTDLTLLVEGKIITTNKAVLSAVCPIVHSLLMEEDTDEHTVIVISDADCNSVKCFLSVILKGSCVIAEEQNNFLSSYLDRNILLDENALENIYNPDKKRKVRHSKGCAFVDGKCMINKNGNFCRRSCRKSYCKRVQCSETASKKTCLETFAPEKEGQPCSLNRNEISSAAITHQGNCKNAFGRTTETSSSDGQNEQRIKANCDKLSPRKRCKLNSLFDDDAFGQCLQCGSKFTSAKHLHLHMKSHLDTPSVKETPAVSDTPAMSETPAVAERSVVKDECPYSINSMYDPEKNSKCIQCDCCEKSFKWKKTLIKHMKAKHSPCKLVCGGVDNNVKIKSTKEHLTCLDCKTVFRTTKLLMTHMKSDHKKDEFRCSKCSVAFLHPDELRHHKESRHPGHGISLAAFTCSGCNKNFRRKAALNNHKRLCRHSRAKSPELETEDTHEHNNTDDKIPVAENLKLHIDEVHTAGGWEMEAKAQESVEFPSVSAAGDEASIESQNADFIEFPVGEATNFSCPECSEIFDNIESFTVHAEEQGHGHLGKSCWICGICRSAFLEESELNEHFSSHSPLPDDYYLHAESPKKQVFIDDMNRIHNDMSCLDTNIINCSVNNCIQREEQDMNEVTNKIPISPHRAEADSSVMDGETFEYKAVGESDISSDSEMDVVTSSMNN